MQVKKYDKRLSTGAYKTLEYRHCVYDVPSCAAISIRENLKRP